MTSSAASGDVKRVAWGCLITALVCGAFLAAVIKSDLDHRNHPRYESTAIGQLKTINTAQTLFREGDKEEDGTLDYGTLQELSNATLIDAVLGSGTKHGYRYTVRPSPTTPEFLWFAVANPVTPGETGDRYFCTNHAGVIHYTGQLGQAIEIDAGGLECAVPSNVQPVGK